MSLIKVLFIMCLTKPHNKEAIAYVIADFSLDFIHRDVKDTVIAVFKMISINSDTLLTKFELYLELNNVSMDNISFNNINEIKEAIKDDNSVSVPVLNEILHNNLEPYKIDAAIFEVFHFQDVKQIELCNNSTCDDTVQRRIFTNNNKVIDNKILADKINENYSFVVSVYEDEKFVCSGGVITSELIVTAASCLLRVRLLKIKLAAITVRVGSNVVYSEGIATQVLFATFHPAFDPISLRNNLVLLKVAKYNLVNANHLDLGEIGSKNTFVTVYGWGIVNDEKYNQISNLKKVNTLNETGKEPLLQFNLSIYNTNECRDIYSSYYVSKNNFCAGLSQFYNEYCKYDIGGLGISNGTLLGIISFGPEGCGTIDKPIVFTSIAPYFSWIKKVIQKGKLYSMTRRRNFRSARRIMPAPLANRVQRRNTNGLKMITAGFYFIDSGQTKRNVEELNYYKTTTQHWFSQVSKENNDSYQIPVIQQRIHDRFPKNLKIPTLLREEIFLNWATTTQRTTHIVITQDIGPSAQIFHFDSIDIKKAPNKLQNQVIEIARDVTEKKKERTETRRTTTTRTSHYKPKKKKTTYRPTNSYGFVASTHLYKPNFQSTQNAYNAFHINKKVKHRKKKNKRKRHHRKNKNKWFIENRIPGYYVRAVTIVGLNKKHRNKRKRHKTYI